MTDLTDIITIRSIHQSDINFILDSTMQCLAKYTESIFKGYTHSTIYSHLELIALYALNRADKYSTFVAVHKDSDRILAYIVADPTENHVLFQYTKYDYRDMCIQRYMLMPLVVDPTLPVTVNWPTKEMLKLAKAGRIVIRNRLTESLIEEKAA